MSVKRPVYPFSAIVGQERLKLALLLNAVNPRIGGVLIRGEKGTAKSTAVRALTRLLPQITVVVNCPYSCPPEHPAGMCAACLSQREGGTLPTTLRPTRLVELPVSASEDRVVGSLDLEHAISEGERRFEPGLLAQVNRGLLYVDEVNLLDDHLVDVLLDAVAMGVNTVEREGISVSHPARFILVGTMNPEEGELRPQLLDRFGLAVDISGLTTMADRMAVIQRRLAYEENPAAFAEHWHAADQQLAERILAAQQILPNIQLQTEDLAIVAGLALEMKVDGHRADLTILETARTHAAWLGRTFITTDDIRLAAQLALPHRMRRQPFAEVQVDENKIGEAVERSAKLISETLPSGGEQKKNHLSDNTPDTAEAMPSPQPSTPTTSSTSASASSTGAQRTPDGQVQHAADPFQTQRIEGQRDQQKRRAGGRRSRTRTTRKSGRYVGNETAARITDLALDATMRVAAPYQRHRREHGAATGAPSTRRMLLQRSDLRQKIRVRRTRNAVCFVVDASWSMAAEERMQATKAAILALLREAYQRRDSVGLVCFQRTYASVLLPLTNSVELAQRCLRQMPTGGKTPLARGMLTGYEMLERARRNNPEVIPLMVLITDGQANVAMGLLPPQQEAYHIAAYIAAQQVYAIAIDTEQPNFDRGLTRQLAHFLEGEYYHLNDLQNDRLARVVRSQLQRLR